MDNHGRKMIAPIIVVLFIILYYSIGIYTLITADIPNIIKIAAAVLSIIITVVLIKVLVERIKEIKEGVEDDLGNY